MLVLCRAELASSCARQQQQQIWQHTHYRSYNCPISQHTSSHYCTTRYPELWGRCCARLRVRIWASGQRNLWVGRRQSNGSKASQVAQSFKRTSRWPLEEPGGGPGWRCTTTTRSSAATTIRWVRYSFHEVYIISKELDILPFGPLLFPFMIGDTFWKHSFTFSFASKGCPGVNIP